MEIGNYKIIVLKIH